MPQIRQEINIINSAYTSTGVSNLGGVIEIDTLRFYSATTFYFDVVASGSTSNTGKVTLRRFGTTTDDASITIGATSGKQLFRTTFPAPWSLANGAGVSQQQYFVYFSGDGTHAQTVYSAKVNVIQKAPQIKYTVSYFEVGGQFTTNSTSYVPLQYPKYWYYDATKYSGVGVTAMFQATLNATASTGGVQAVLQYAPTPNTFSGWTNVPNTEVTATTSGQNLLYNTANNFFTLTSNTYYRVAVLTQSSGNPVTISNAKVALMLNDGSTTHVPYYGKNINGGIASQGTWAQQFKVYNPTLITGVNVFINASSPAPSDQLGFFIVPTLNSSVSGFPSNTVAYGLISGSTIGTTLAPYNINFTQPAVLSAGTWYCAAIRQPDVSGSTFYAWEQEGYGGATYADGGNWSRYSGNNWLGGAGVLNMYLELVGTTGVQNFESELLITNTLLAAGTTAQSGYTNFNNTDWFNAQNNYIFVIDAASASTSNVSLITSGKTFIASGQPKNQIYVTGFTPPYLAQVLDVSASTNNNDVYATKLKIQTRINLERPTPPSVNPFYA
jgi:hypothetical protein